MSEDFRQKYKKYQTEDEWKTDDYKGISTLDGFVEAQEKKDAAFYGTSQKKSIDNVNVADVRGFGELNFDPSGNVSLPRPTEAIVCNLKCTDIFGAYGEETVKSLEQNFNQTVNQQFVSPQMAEELACLEKLFSTCFPERANKCPMETCEEVKDFYQSGRPEINSLELMRTILGPDMAILSDHKNNKLSDVADAKRNVVCAQEYEGCIGRGHSWKKEAGVT